MLQLFSTFATLFQQKRFKTTSLSLISSTFYEKPNFLFVFNQLSAICLGGAKLCLEH